MGIIKGSQLSLIQKLYGIPGSQSLGITDVDLDTLTQTLPVVPEILRRSDNILGNSGGGWFNGVMENVHSGADIEVCSLVPYTPGAGAVRGFPNPVRPGWDIWLLGASLIRTSGTGGAIVILDINTPGGNGLGIDDSGDPVLDTPIFPVARWTTFVDDLGGGSAPELGLGPAGSLHCYQPIGIRLPRPCDLELRGDSDAAVTYQCAMIMGIFPEAMGQDVAT